MTFLFLMTRYKNPWYNKSNPCSEEWYSITYNTKAEQYKDFYIIRNVNPWVDVVESVDGEFYCVTQVGSIRYAKEWIDSQYKDLP